VEGAVVERWRQHGFDPGDCQFTVPESVVGERNPRCLKLGLTDSLGTDEKVFTVRIYVSADQRGIHRSIPLSELDYQANDSQGGKTVPLSINHGVAFGIARRSFIS